MRNPRTRRRWVPGRQTLNDDPGDTTEPIDRQDEDEVTDGKGDATFDRSYGWLDLRRADPETGH